MLSTRLSVSTSHSTAQPSKMAVKYAQQTVRRVTWAWVQGWVLQSNVIWWQSRAAGAADNQADRAVSCPGNLLTMECPLGRTKLNEGGPVPAVHTINTSSCRQTTGITRDLVCLKKGIKIVNSYLEQVPVVSWSEYIHKPRPGGKQVSPCHELFRKAAWLGFPLD